MNVSRFQRQKHLGVAPPPQGHKGLKKGVYVVPSLFTAMNILAGFYSLMATMSGFKLLGLGDVAGATTRFDYAAMAIGAAFVCDTLDGRIGDGGRRRRFGTGPVPEARQVVRSAGLGAGAHC